MKTTVKVINFAAGLMAMLGGLSGTVLANEIPPEKLVTISINNEVWPSVAGADAPMAAVTASSTFVSGFSGMTSTHITVDYAKPGDYQLWLTGMMLDNPQKSTFLYQEFSDSLTWTYNVIGHNYFSLLPPYVTWQYYAIIGNYQVTEFFVTRAPAPPIINPVPEAGTSAMLLSLGVLGLGFSQRRKKLQTEINRH